MNTLPWVSVALYENGTALDETTLNIPITDLIQRTDYLKAVIDSFGTPFSTVTISGIELSNYDIENNTAPSPGDFVYIDTATKTLRKALAEIDQMDDMGDTPSSHIAGYFLSAVNNVVAIYGEIRNVQKFSSKVDEGESATSGIYYLSSTKAGKITKYPSGPRVLVGTFLVNDNDVATGYLTPEHRSFAESHVHRTVKLSSLILSGSDIGNDSVEGWVDEPGYYYRYQMAKDTVLAAFYPPVPIQSATLVINGFEVPSENVDPENGVYKILPDGIRVKKEAFSQKSTGSSIFFHFVRGISSDTGPVTSLRPAPNSPISVKKCGTRDDATVGDLEIDVDFNIQDKDANTPGFMVYKEFSEGMFKRGPVVEKIIGVDGISVTQQNSNYPGQGTVVISLDTSSTSGEFDTVALQNAKEEMLGFFPFVKLPRYYESVPASFTAKFQVPVNLNPLKYRLLFYATLFGFSRTWDPAYAPILFTYNIIPNLYSQWSKNNLKTGMWSNDPLYIEIPFPRNYNAYDPFLLTNDEDLANSVGTDNAVYVQDLFKGATCPVPTVNEHSYDDDVPVYPGYLVAVRLERTSRRLSTASTYTDSLGFINLRWKTVPVIED